MKKVLFIDRDGTLIREPESDFQVDSLEKLEYYPGVFRWLGAIAAELDYELVMVTNQDGLGTPSFPEEQFWPVQNTMLKAFRNEGIVFSDILVDRSFPSDNSPNRKPGTGMLMKYIHGNYNLPGSFVIGDRETDMQLAKNLGSKGILIGSEPSKSAALTTVSWEEIYRHLEGRQRTASWHRVTSETDVFASVNLDGSGKSSISTGIRFLDHMLEQVARHGSIDLTIKAKGDTDIDEHHTIEDIAIVIGRIINDALGSRRGIERYGFLLPMDDSLASVAIDLGGRPWLVWDVEFRRGMVGDMPVEMFFHFFKSFSDNALCNLNIKAEGENDHHRAEAIFKAFARALKMAVKRGKTGELPTTKGII